MSINEQALGKVLPPTRSARTLGWLLSWSTLFAHQHFKQELQLDLIRGDLDHLLRATISDAQQQMDCLKENDLADSQRGRDLRTDNRYSPTFTIHLPQDRSLRDLTPKRGPIYLFLLFLTPLEPAETNLSIRYHLDHPRSPEQAPGSQPYGCLCPSPDPDPGKGKASVRTHQQGTLQSQHRYRHLQVCWQDVMTKTQDGGLLVSQLPPLDGVLKAGIFGKKQKRRLTTDMATPFLPFLCIPDYQVCSRAIA